MKIHEYQAKEILKKFGVAIPRGILATTPLQAEVAARQLGGGICAVKAQIHAGGRGKAGGIKLARSPEEAKTHAEELIGAVLVTPQTGPQGQEVRKLYIEEGMRIARELYLGITLDRERSRMTVMASSEGGVDIEEVAKAHPEKILKEPVDPLVGFMPYQARQLAFALGLQGDSVGAFVRFATGLSAAVVATDASLAEINPVVVTASGGVIALDAKLNFDDNALYRHPDIREMRDLTEEDPLEIEASKFSLNYIRLDGTIGCMVNGAGLAMATMDIIKLAGGEPANFLDVGGGANAEQIRNAFKILMSDANVKAVFINIFGGILRCDILSEGVVAAVKELGVKVPIVIRMAGTNVETGKKMLKDSGLNFTTADTMAEGASKVVELSRR